MVKKKAQKLDRDKKVIKIGKWKLRTDLLCGGVLVVVLTLSSFGFVATRMATEPEELPIGQVRAVVYFGNVNQVSDIVDLEEDMTALGAFEQIVVMQTAQTSGGIAIESVSHNETIYTAEGNQTWLFYVNGAISFKDIGQFKLQHADTIELRLEDSLF